MQKERLRMSTNSCSSILGYLPHFLPRYTFRINFLSIFIPSLLILRIQDRNELAYLKYADISAIANFILRFLLGRCMNTGFTSLRIRNIAEELHIAENTARKYIEELKEKGFLMTFFDPETSSTVFVLLAAAFLPLLVRCGIELIDNYMPTLANIDAKMKEEYRRQNPYASSLEDYRKIMEEEELKIKAAIKNGGHNGGLASARLRAEASRPSAFEGLASNHEGPSNIYYKNLENNIPTTHPGESSSQQNRQETAEIISYSVETWVDEFKRLAELREPAFEGEAPLYSLSPEGIPVFNDDPRCSAVQNASRYVEFKKLVGMAKKRTTKRLSRPSRVRFKKEEKHADKDTSRKSTSSDSSTDVSPNQKLKEEATAYAQANGMQEGVVLIVYRLVSADKRREELLELLRKYPKATAYIEAVCKKWLELQRLGELPPLQEILASIQAHMDYKWSLDSSRQYIPDLLSYLKNQMWLFAEQWKPKKPQEPVTVAQNEYAAPPRSAAEQALFEVRSKVVSEIKEHFNLVTGQVYGALHRAHIWAVEKLESVLNELPMFSGTIDEWLGNVKLRLA